LLHIVNKSPFSETGLDSCLRAAQKGDPILLIEDAVMGAVTGTSIESKLKDAQKDHEVYALQADLKARGLDRLMAGVKVVDYSGFVDLVEQHKTMSWL